MGAGSPRSRSRKTASGRFGSAERRRGWEASGGEKPDEDEQAKESGPGWFQENLEAVVVAIIFWETRKWKY